MRGGGGAVEVELNCVVITTGERGKVKTVEDKMFTQSRPYKNLVAMSVMNVCR